MDLVNAKDEELLKMQLKEVNRRLKVKNSTELAGSYKGYNLQNFLRFKELDSKITQFIDIFMENFSDEHISNMLKRLETLSMTDIDSKTPKDDSNISLGIYNRIENRIYLNCYSDIRIEREKDYESFYCELLNMASTRELPKGIITGLEGTDSMGIGLNSGYTKYLARKYFIKSNDYVYSNDDDLFHAKGIENIVGKEKMQEYFFSANLEGLISELSKYASLKEINRMLFLMNVDHYERKKDKTSVEITAIIAKMNARKLLERFENGELSVEEYQYEYAKKVSEYEKHILWGEETKVIRDENLFVLYEQGDSSSIYEFKEATVEKQKKYE